MADAEKARDWLCTPAAQVSAHYVISRDGTCWHLVEETKRAWHAGVASWEGAEDVNSRSIGIELVNTGAEPFAEPQMACLEHLLQRLMQRWQILPHRVIGHSDCAPGRKIDPGPRFDWVRLARQGLARSPAYDAAPERADMDLFRRVAQQAGYSMPVSDDVLLAAVRLRYRPTASGQLVPEDFMPLQSTALWT
jgi:N-acetylmuramoyl-L-alanine amidase